MYVLVLTINGRTPISVDMPNDKAFEDGQRLLKLKQTETTRAYISDSRALASGVSYDDAALKSIFYQGLSDKVKDIICYREEPNSLEEYIQMAQDIDSRLLEREEEKRVASRQSARRVVRTAITSNHAHGSEVFK
jgi:hypothetical protein